MEGSVDRLILPCGFSPKKAGRLYRPAYLSHFSYEKKLIIRMDASTTEIKAMG